MLALLDRTLLTHRMKAYTPSVQRTKRTTYVPHSLPFRHGVGRDTGGGDARGSCIARSILLLASDRPTTAIGSDSGTSRTSAEPVGAALGTLPLFHGN